MRDDVRVVCGPAQGVGPNRFEVHPVEHEERIVLDREGADRNQPRTDVGWLEVPEREDFGPLKGGRGPADRGYGSPEIAWDWAAREPEVDKEGFATAMPRIEATVE